MLHTLTQPTSSASLGRGKRLIFRLASVALGLLLVAALELVARLLTGSGDGFVTISSFTLFSHTEIDGTPHLAITHPYAYPDRKTVFPLEKPSGGLRIFCLGGSAAAGWPHPPQETFSSYLETMLQERLPGRPVEVINAAAHGFPAYRVRRVFDEVIDLDPDVIILFTGNNEFLERRSYGSTGVLESLGRRLRLAQLATDLVRRRHTRLSGDELNEVAATLWSKVKQQALELRSDPEQLAAVTAHYSASLEHMVQVADQRGVEVFVLTVPSNLRDWLPTVSAHTLSGDAADRWQETYLRGRRDLLEGRIEEAVRGISAAIGLEPDHAESHFWLGRAYEASGRAARSRHHYRRSKDLDYNPFRALSRFNEAVRAVAATAPRATVVDLEHLFDEAAVHPAPGFELFLDYVHPTTAGNRLIAEAVFEALAAEQVGGLSPGARAAAPVTTYDESADYTVQMRIFGMSTMNHQYEASLARAERLRYLVESAPAGASSGAPPATVPRAVSEVLTLFPELLELERREILGRPLAASERDRIDAALEEFYERWYRYLTI